MRITSSEDKGWGLETTTQRTIRSSKDAGTPGRAGDVILGGGIELVYKISDILDIVNDARTLKKPCLYVYGEITWLPRKPTSYIMSVASIETQVVPNLYYLRSLVKEGGIAADGSEMLYDCDSARRVRKCQSARKRINSKLGCNISMRRLTFGVEHSNGLLRKCST